MRCDLCALGSEAGPVLLIETDPPAFERRTKPRRQHEHCADALATHRAMEKARTRLWLDEQYEAFEARRIAVTA